MAIIQNLEAFVQSYPAGLDSVTDLQLSQNENGRQIRFTIGGVTIPAGSVATISGTKPDGVVYSNTGTIEGSDTVIFDEDVQMTAVFGTWYAKIRITNAGNTIASARVRFIIDKDPVDAGAIPSESQLNGLVAEAEEYAGAAEDAAERAAITYGSPLTAATASAMTDINRVYVYTGSESGYTYGNWYYYNGSAWVSGGVYNSAAVETDTTLTESGVPADAKATGDKIDELKDDFIDVISIQPINLVDGIQWEIGSIDASTGTNLESTQRLRTVGYIDVSPYKAVTFNIENGYKYVYDTFNANHIISQEQGAGNWQTTTKKMIFSDTVKYIRVLLADTSDGVVNISYADHISVFGEAPITNVLERKNALLDIYKSDIESGSLQTPSMAVSPYIPAVALLEYLPTQPTEKIKIEPQTITGIAYQYRFGFYKADKTWIDQIAYTTDNVLTVPNNCYYISVGLYASDPITGNVLTNYNLYANMANGIAFKLIYLDRYTSDYMTRAEVENLIEHSTIPTSTDIVSLNKDAYGKLLQAKRPINNSANAYLSETQPLVLFHFSDIHADTVELQRAVNFIDEYSDMIDDSICTGDLVLERWDNGFSYWSGVSGSEKILLCIGNHDVLTDPSGWDWTQRATQADQYSRYFAPYISNWNCTYDSGKTYYYKDYVTKNIRLIVLNCMLTGYDDTEQLAWFESVLSGAKTNGYSVVVANHYMVENAEKIPCNFTSIDKGIGTDVLPSAYINAVQTFINGGGAFVCHLVGHTHNDLIVRSATYNNQLCVVIDALNRAQGNQYSDTQRTDGTKTQDLANLFVVDTASKVIKIIRIGANIDHYLRKKICITIDYETGTIIAQN